MNLQDFLEYFELTLLCILHPRYNSIPAENRMGDMLSPKITDKVVYIQHHDGSRDNSTDLFRVKAILINYHKVLRAFFGKARIYDNNQNYRKLRQH